MIGNRDIKLSKDCRPSILDEAVATGLQKIGFFAKEMNATVHKPRFDCGLAGGTWDKMEPVIQAALVDQGIPVIPFTIWTEPVKASRYLGFIFGP